MTERAGAGQADKKAAEERTQQVAAENRATEARAAKERDQSTDAEAKADADRSLSESQRAAKNRREQLAKIQDPNQSGDPSFLKNGVVADTAAERVAGSEAPEVGFAAELIDPYPAYEVKSLDELRSLAKSRGVEINRDTEKATYVGLLRAKDGSPAYDLMTLEQLREKAQEMDVQLPAEYEIAQLTTELRAADTHPTGGVDITANR